MKCGSLAVDNRGLELSKFGIALTSGETRPTGYYGGSTARRRIEKIVLSPKQLLS